MQRFDTNSHRTQSSVCLLAGALLFYIVAISAHSANYYWDANGSTAGFGTAGGTWGAPTPGPTIGWSTDSTGASAIGSITTAHGDSARFGTDAIGLAAGTITIPGTVSTSNLFFGKASGALTLDGGTISISTGNTQIKAASGGGSAKTMSINSDIDKLSGTLQIGRQNTVGEHYIFNGSIGGATGTDLRPRNNAAYIAFNGVNTFPAHISLVTGQLNVNTVADSGVACSLGTGSIISMGGGGGQEPLLWYTGAGAASTNRTFRSSSTSSNRIVAQDGALDLSGALTTTGSGSYQFQFAGTADTGTNTVSGVISDGSGTINVRVTHTTPQAGSGEQGYWRFTGVNTYTGYTTIQNASRMIIDGAGQLGSGTYANNVNITQNGTFEYSSTADQTITGLVTGNGAGGLVKSDSGTLEILSTSNFTGPTTVSGGTLRISNTADLDSVQTSGFSINGTGTLEIESSVGGPNRTNYTAKTFTFDSTGGGAVNFNNGNHLFQSWGITNFITNGGNKNTISSTNGGFMNMQTAGTIKLTVADGTDDVDLDLAVRWQNGFMTKEGPGTVEVTGTYTGTQTATVNDGTLQVTSSVGGGVTVNSGGTLAGIGTIGGSVTVASGGVFSPGAP